MGLRNSWHLERRRPGGIGISAPSLHHHGVSGIGCRVYSLEDDYNTFSKRGQLGEHDLWGQHFQNLIRARLGYYALSLVEWQFHKVNGQDLARIHVDPSAHPIYDHKGQKETFWHRTPVRTLAITDPKERAQIIATRWGNKA